MDQVNSEPCFFLLQKVHDLSGSVPRPGKYAAIVHYYQPMHASFDSKVSITSDRALDGTVRFHYCPHTSGCRSVIRNLNAATFFDIGRTSVGLEFTIPANSSTWIVSFLAIRALWIPSVPNLNIFINLEN